MSVLVNKETRLVVQGMTGKEGMFHTQAGGGVRHHRGGRRYPRQGRPGGGRDPGVQHRVGGGDEDRRQRSVVFVPPPFAADAVMEAADAGVKLVVCITEGVPTLDMVRVMRFLERPGYNALIGPNCPGDHHARRVQDRHHAGPYSQAGRPVGVVSRSRHADLRGGGPADRPRHRPVHLRRHRRRSDHRHGLYRHADRVTTPTRIPRRLS